MDTNQVESNPVSVLGTEQRESVHRTRRPARWAEGLVWGGFDMISVIGSLAAIALFSSALAAMSICWTALAFMLRWGVFVSGLGVKSTLPKSPS